MIQDNRSGSDMIRKVTAGVTVIAAFVMWYLMFAVKPFNFWLMMSMTTSVMIIVATAVQRPLIRWEEFTARNILTGIVSAFVLYGVFFLGDILTSLILPTRAVEVTAVYDTRSLMHPALVGGLLLFPIGPGEELYWRGFLQRFLGEKISSRMAFFIVVALYTGVHIPAGNIMLITAAFVCGIFWGGLYLATGSIVPGLISHMIWDPLIFIILPVR